MQKPNYDYAAARERLEAALDKQLENQGRILVLEPQPEEPEFGKVDYCNAD